MTFFDYNFSYAPRNFDNFLDMVDKIKSSGNHFFKLQDNKTAARKYRKTLKYLSVFKESLQDNRFATKLTFIM